MNCEFKKIISEWNILEITKLFLRRYRLTKLTDEIRSSKYVKLSNKEEHSIDIDDTFTPLSLSLGHFIETAKLDLIRNNYVLGYESVTTSHFVYFGDIKVPPRMIRYSVIKCKISVNRPMFISWSTNKTNVARYKLELYETSI